ncbi:RES family NAD+ phosphorylase [Pseudothauera lacus]|uniref:RES domain-containing protein n=1 Tax=Pseudothauera lacus TaxID=2136175 RepID=A0A2T4III8_9RHOO|nr:RES family NAD+ phosphorylase [Pseudothauera lacus]PTD97582.1 RES domain-containing protein [Pseudothauera lacus]
MASLWRLAQDWVDLDSGALLCAAEDFSCAGAGAAAVGGRWNSVGSALIYLADSVALAQLERRVHAPHRPPAAQVLVEVDLPAPVLAAARVIDPPPGWDAPNTDWSVGRCATQALGDAWCAEGGTLLLRVPSVVVPVGWNYLLNPRHRDMKRVTTRRMSYAPDARLW